MHQHVYWYRCSMRNSNFPLQSVLRSAMSIADHVADSALSVKPLPIPGFFFFSVAPRHLVIVSN